MGEVAGLVIGAMSLAGVFTSCVDCFEYVQVGRNFGKDYNISVLKLDVLKLKLSKWGSAVNDHQGQLAASTREAQLASDLLGEILILFCEAEERSKAYNLQNDINANTQDAARPTNERDIQQIRNKMRELALRRQKRSSFKQKTVWALYERGIFEQLITNVTHLVDSLIQLFPAERFPDIRTSREQMAIEDAGSVLNLPGIEELEQAASNGADTMLLEAVQNMPQVSRRAWVRNKLSDRAKAQYGDHVMDGTIARSNVDSSWEENLGTGQSRALYGDKLGGKSVLDD